jgi:hypothetical protein
MNRDLSSFRNRAFAQKKKEISTLCSFGFHVGAGPAEPST